MDKHRRWAPRYIGYVVAFWLAFCPGLLPATVWYMAPAPLGNDGNPGSMAQPFNTFWEAGTHALPGDTVYVRGGTYALTQPAWIPCSGAAGVPITFAAYPGETPVIDGTGIGVTATVLGLGGSYLAVRGLSVVGGGEGIVAWGFSHEQITGNTLSGTAGSGIYVGYSSLGMVSDVLISGNTVHNCVAENNPPGVGAYVNGWPASVSTYWVTSATVSANLVYDNFGEGLAITHCDGILLTGNTVHDNFSIGIYFDNVQGSTITANLAYTTGDPAYFRFGLPCPSIAMANENFTPTTNPLDGCLVSDNVTVGGRYGFYYGNYENGGGLKNFTVVHNTFYNAAQEGLWIDPDPGHVGNLFADNLVTQAGSGSPAYFGGPASGFTFTHNAWYPSSPGGTLAGPGDVTGAPLFQGPGGLAAMDYQLLSGSPGIGAGIPVAGVSTDAAGVAFTMNPALGAYEWVQPGVTATPTPTSNGATPTPPAAAIGPLSILRTAAVPQPNPDRLMLDLSSACGSVTVKVYTRALVLAFQQTFAGASDGWTSLSLGPQFAHLASGSYYATVSAKALDGSVVHATQKLVLLR